VGFIRGVLSNTKLGWAEPDDVKKMYSFKQTIDWMCKFVGQDFNKLTVNTEEVKKKKFINQINSIIKFTPSGVKGGISREQIVASLEIPATYYVNRGFSKEILTKYDVGLCKNSAKEMYNRVVVPIYDNDKKTMVACTGRSIHPACTKCELYHSGNCPEGNGKYVAYSKWRNNSNSNVSSYLYNYWNAKDFIKRSGVVIVVEGPPDIWRLEELGVHNAVALFGVDMSEEQQILLEMSGALSVVILTDMDKPGRIAVEDIKSKLRSFRTVAPELSVKDAGELTSEKYEAEVKPHVQKLERQYTL
jgi:5S rRNA maturation endonuclease (ribonuclease M5)